MAWTPVRCRIPELLPRGENQTWLAIETGFGPQRISDYVTLRVTMSLPVAKTIADILNCQIDDLYVWRKQ